MECVRACVWVGTRRVKYHRKSNECLELYNFLNNSSPWHFTLWPFYALHLLFSSAVLKETLLGILFIMFCRLDCCVYASMCVWVLYLPRWLINCRLSRQAAKTLQWMFLWMSPSSLLSFSFSISPISFKVSVSLSTLFSLHFFCLVWLCVAKYDPETFFFPSLEHALQVVK